MKHFVLKQTKTPRMTPPQTETYCRIDLNTPRGCTIHPVVFMGNPQSKEVQELKCQYEKELEDFWKFSKEKKLSLSLILEQLTREPEKLVVNDLRQYSRYYIT